MKGPSLRYNMRVLRVFTCDRCGRQVQTPGNVTTQTCLCSDPPKFMRPLDRPRTVSPDVSMFISPADPDDLIEVDEIDEIPYVLHVPVKPPPPARFANRRKLYDDTAAQDELDFGAGIVHDIASDSLVKEESSAAILGNPGREKPPEEPDKAPGDKAVGDKAVGDKERSRRRRRVRGGEADAARPPGRNAAPPVRRPDVGGRPGAAQAGSARDAGQTFRNPNAKSENSVQAGPADGDLTTDNDSKADPSSEQSSSERRDGRRRSRRRGRRRGPRPEGGSA